MEVNITYKVRFSISIPINELLWARQSKVKLEELIEEYAPSYAQILERFDDVELESAYQAYVEKDSEFVLQNENVDTVFYE